MEEDIKNLLETVVKRYIEEYIINLDLSDSTKNMLKRQLRKIFLDEDLLYDLGTIAHKNSIPTSLIKEKIEEYKKVIEITKEQLKHEENVDVRRRHTTTIEQVTAGILVLQELLREE